MHTLRFSQQLLQARIAAEGLGAALGPGCASPAHTPSFPKCQNPSPAPCPDTRCARMGLQRDPLLLQDFAQLLSLERDQLGMKQTGSRSPLFQHLLNKRTKFVFECCEHGSKSLREPV